MRPRSFITRLRTATVAVLALLALLPGSHAAIDEPAPLAITNAVIFDGTGSAPYSGSLLARDGRIVAIGADIAIPADARLVDAGGQALLPGLFDLHTHWTPGNTPPDLPGIANAYIATGVTTVFDFHQPPEAYEPRRAWLEQLAAPHVHFIARFSTSGGHGASWADENTTRWVDSPAAARRALAEVVPYRPDAIKIFTDGWRYGLSPDLTSMDPDTLQALVEAAHANGFKVLTHTVTVGRGRVAADAGVDVIAHSLQDQRVDQPTIDALLASGTYYAPTLAVYEPGRPGTAPVDPDSDNPAVIQRIRKFDDALYNVKTLFEAGVPVAVATDAGMFPHRGATAREVELLVQAGLSPAQALVAGTATSAAAVGLQADRGTLETGKRADLLLVDGRPWENIGEIRNVAKVFVDGRQVYGEGADIPAANHVPALPAVAIGALVDDFDRPDGRTRLDTLRIDEADGGNERSRQVTTLVNNPGQGQSLLVAAVLSDAASPYVSTILPLSRGSVAPADLRPFNGLRFDIRGNTGGGQLLLRTTGEARWRAELDIPAEWRTVELDFDALSAVVPARGTTTGVDRSWSGDDVVSIAFVGTGEAGQRIWFELDNVRFY